jgi:hypothetical protein
MHEPDDHVSIHAPAPDPSLTRPVVVGRGCATRHPDDRLARARATRGRLEEASDRLDRIANPILPNALRLLAWAREHEAPALVG